MKLFWSATPLSDGSSESDVKLSDSDTDDLAEKLSDWALTFSIPLTATSGLL